MSPETLEAWLHSQLSLDALCYASAEELFEFAGWSCSLLNEYWIAVQA